MADDASSAAILTTTDRVTDADSETPWHTEPFTVLSTSGQRVTCQWKEGVLWVRGKKRAKLPTYGFWNSLTPLFALYNHYCVTPEWTLDDIGERIGASRANVSLTIGELSKKPSASSRFGDLRRTSDLHIVTAEEGPSLLAWTLEEWKRRPRQSAPAARHKPQKEARAPRDAKELTCEKRSLTLVDEQTTPQDSLPATIVNSRGMNVTYQWKQGVLWVRGKARHKLPTSGYSRSIAPLIAVYNQWAINPMWTIEDVAEKIGADDKEVGAYLNRLRTKGMGSVLNAGNLAFTDETSYVVKADEAATLLPEMLKRAMAGEFTGPRRPTGTTLPRRGRNAGGKTANATTSTPAGTAAPAQNDDDGFVGDGSFDEDALLAEDDPVAARKRWTPVANRATVNDLTAHPKGPIEREYAVPPPKPTEENPDPMPSGNGPEFQAWLKRQKSKFDGDAAKREQDSIRRQARAQLGDDVLDQLPASPDMPAVEKLVKLKTADVVAAMVKANFKVIAIPETAAPEAASLYPDALRVPVYKVPEGQKVTYREQSMIDKSNRWVLQAPGIVLTLPEKGSKAILDGTYLIHLATLPGSALVRPHYVNTAPVFNLTAPPALDGCFVGCCQLSARSYLPDVVSAVNRTMKERGLVAFTKPVKDTFVEGFAKDVIQRIAYRGAKLRRTTFRI
ncbi:MAG: hypothetical protein AB7G06_07790 [Bdellovibrionales bacterium]